MSNMFCPRCGCSLFMGFVYKNQVKFMAAQCHQCPYIHRIRKPHIVDSPVNPKPVDDILGGADAWKNVDSTEERCPKCEHPRAYFMQIQTRSADEPMTTFYRCCNHECCHQWRE